MAMGRLDTGVRPVGRSVSYSPLGRDSSFRRKPESRMRRCDEVWALAGLDTGIRRYDEVWCIRRYDEAWGLCRFDEA